MLTLNDEEFGVNVRGDVMNSDSDYVGHWNGHSVNYDAEEPDDWDQIVE